MKNNQALTDFIAKRSNISNISCKSYIVTFFGDVLSQHGDWLWLGSLIEALKPLGFSERLIRTSVFRLVQDDWLQTNKEGRCSYYAFTDSARLHYEKAARRIYAGKAASWHGNWLIVLPSFVPEEQLVNFRRQLHWLGFSTLSSGVFAHPSIDKQSLEETLDEMNLTNAVIVFTSKTLDDSSANVLKKLVRQRWHLDDLEQEYQHFLGCYQPILDNLVAMDLTEQQSFLMRTLLIHEYRRMLLKDHELPLDMLPESWSGFSAHELVDKLYAALAQSSLRYISQELKNSSGLLPKEQNTYWQRFND